jgi:hypothetical protein
VRNTMDSFLKFLQDELSSSTPTVTIHALRYDVNNPDSSRLQLNALNVYFMDANYDTDITTLMASLDIIYEDELTAVDVRDAVWGALNKTFFIRKKSYIIPSTPVSLSTCIYWERGSILFNKVASDDYVHFSCPLLLYTHIL